MNTNRDIVDNETLDSVENEYTLSNVPNDARKPWLSIFIVLLGFTFLSTTMAAGATIGASFNFADLAKIMIVGNLILSIYAGVLCYIAAKTGLTSVLWVRYSLGRYGAKWAGILLGGTQVFWYAIQSAYFGELFTQGLGLEKYFVPITAFFAIIMGLTALRGTRGMEIISYLSLPAFLYLAYKLPVLSIEAAGGISNLINIEPTTSSITFISAVTMVIGTFISGATNAPNWARFSRNPNHGFWAGFLGFFLGTFVMVASGMLAGLAIQEGDIILIMMQMGIIIMAIAILVFNIWTTNASTAYAFSVAGSEFFNKPDRKPFLIGGLIIGTIVAVIGIYDYFTPFLIAMGTFIPPLGGIMIGDYLYTWRKGFPKIEFVEFRDLRYANLIAYVIATLGTIISNNIGFGIPTINGVVLSIVLVWVVNIIFDKQGIDDHHKIAEDAEYMAN